SRMWENAALIGAALALIFPGWQYDLLGFGLAAAVIVAQKMAAAPVRA
ncbi:MAG: hypothetical protein JNJ97_08865, partial [Alphaproteobacteria bacterium]|nr:hypothetical protein [Alphaproteobacteria bacterium]